MWELDHKEGWAPKNWYFWTVGLENILESPLDYMDINPVNPKENQSWIFIERTDAEAETPVLWPPDAKNWLTGKDPGAGKDGGQEERGMTEGEMVGWHHWLDGREFEQSPGVDEGQGSLACCSPWGRKSQTWLSGWKTTAKTFSSGGDPLSMWLLSLDCGLIRLTLPCFAIRKGPCLWHIRFCLSSEHWEKESSFCFVLWRLNDTVS